MQKEVVYAQTAVTRTGDRRLYAVLESWRGICACMVVLWHVPALGPLPQTALIRGSYLFTDFFFVLSGFIIFENYHDRLRDGFGLRRFMFLRFGRLYPLHLFVLALFILDELARFGGDPGEAGLRGSFTDPNSLPSLGLHLGLLNAHGLYPTSSWNTPAWSIEAEFYTYLLFAAVILVAASAMSYVLAGIFAACMAVLLLSGRPDMDIAHDLGFVRCAAGFALGALSQRFMAHSGWAGPRPGSRASVIELVLLVVVFVFVALAGRNRASFAAPLLFAAVILVFAAEAGAVSRVLGAAPFRFIGTISYSVYMIHLYLLNHVTSMAKAAGTAIGIPLTTTVQSGEETIIAFGSAPWQGTLSFILVLPLVLLVAATVYGVVELPSRRASRRIAARMGA